MTGTRQLGKYEIIEELGKGGFATVYRARDPDLDREVALKVLDPLLTRDPVWVARFRREARAVARLDHPHVVTIYEVGEAHGMLYIVNRLVEGGNLAARIREEGPLPWDEVVRLTAEIAAALDYAHDAGVVHRDLKAGNVLLDGERGAQLTDFGFASIVSESSFSVSISGGVVGTPQYIAPEVWEGQPATPQTDIYALGCIVYEMVVGKHLFQGDTTPSVMRAHFQPVTLPEAWPEGVPPGLEAVLQKALAKEPGQRYARAGALAQALSALREDRLAGPYAALQAAVADKEWEQALELARAIRVEDAGYRNVVLLEETALDGLDLSIRVREAVTWKAEAERALAEGDLRGAEMAARQWGTLLPEDAEVEAFLAQVEAQASPIEAPEVKRAASSAAESPPTWSKSEPSSSLRVVEPLSTKESPRRGVPGWVWAVAVVLLLAIAVALAVALSGGGAQEPVVVKPTPTSSPTATSAPMLPDSWEYGAIITHVADGYPAQEAGFQAGDIVIAVDSTAVDADSNPLDQLIQGHEPGDLVVFWLVRPPGTTPFSLTAELTEHPDVVGSGYLGIFWDRNLLQKVAIVNTPTPLPPTPTPPPLTGTIFMVSDRDSAEDIYIVPANGSASPRRISNSGLDYAPYWSPSGDIVFASKREGKIDIYSMNAAGGQVRQITDTESGLTSPVLAPTGDRIAFRADTVAWAVLDSGEVRTIDFWPDKLAWSPDGSRIAMADRVYVSGDEPRHVRVDVMDLTQVSSSPTTIFEGLGAWDWWDSDALDWSPDGEWIALALAPDDPYEEVGIYKVRIDGSELTKMADVAGAEDTHPVWSPDGSELLFVSTSDTREDDSIDACDRSVIYRVSADGSGLTRLTESSVESYDPVWSPDGRRIAFVVLEDRSNEIYVMDADGANKVRLTDPADGADEYHPTWSPDGTQIAFASSGYSPRIYALDPNTHLAQVVVTDTAGIPHTNPRLPPDGSKLAFTREYGFSSNTKSLTGGNGGICSSEEIVIVPNPLSALDNELPDTSSFPLSRQIVNWSDDGRWLLYGGWSGSGPRLWDAQNGESKTLENLPERASYYATLSPDGQSIAYFDYDDGQVYLLPVDGGEKTHLSIGANAGYSRPLFSPDGTRIMFRVEGGLEIRDLSGTVLHGIQADEYVSEFTWLSDGRRAAYTFYEYDQDGDWSGSGIWIYSVAEGKSTRLTTWAGDLSGLVSSPDSLWLVFFSRSEGNSEIYAVPTGGGAVVNLSRDPAEDSYPVWVPSGTALPLLASPADPAPSDSSGARTTDGAIAFTSEQTGYKEIFLMDANGQNLTQLTEVLGSAAFNPAWSPDGQRIAYDSWRGEGWDVFVMDADGDNVQQLTHDPAYDGNADWSPDGGSIVFNSFRDGDSEIYVIRSDGTGVTRLTDNPASDSDPCWSPDGELIAFVSNRKGMGIYLMNRDGSGVRRVTLVSGSYAYPNWSPDGHSIVFATDADGDYDICIAEVDTGEVRCITNNSDDDWGASWSPDGQQIVFASDREGDLEIYVMDADGGNVRRLTDNDAEDYRPAWRP